VLDVFGGERRTVEGLGAQVDAQRYAAKAAYLTLSANVVNTCIARAAYAAQIGATQALIALEVEQLHSIEAQVRAGTSPYANVLSQRSLIAANLPDIGLDTLTLPQDLPVSLPSELARQRPDILAAEAQLHATSADIGVATAAMFPSFSLNATFGGAGTSLGNLTAASGRFWSIGPSLTAPLFRGGTLAAQRQAAIDAFEVQQANYRQTVLIAFGQVADALKALEHDAQALPAQGAARDTAAEALALLRTGYRTGLVAYIDVMTADVQYHQALVDTVQAVAQRQQDTVALFVALGGGWWNAPGAEADAKMQGAKIESAVGRGVKGEVQMP
jgi:outer membrane protein TolC